MDFDIPSFIRNDYPPLSRRGVSKYMSSLFTGSFDEDIVKDFCENNHMKNGMKGEFQYCKDEIVKQKIRNGLNSLSGCVPHALSQEFQPLIASDLELKGLLDFLNF